ncbi:hypothetical protein MAR_005706 [Mya arenaria]|uniref:G-protein coupled receptors family 1 profile domain-containing protein n=1 Tax=Mya arenaria TaxID=6604 RepID=A0ABY7F3G9_MYAAR|nr:hypothetical protein MAR_005706 [Mya arenaria]
MNISNVSNTFQNASKTFNGTRYVEIEGAREWCLASLVLAWLLVILTITMNTAVIVCICSQKKKSRLYFLLLNMALADLLTGIFDTFVNATERSLGYEDMTWAWFAGLFRWEWFDEDFQFRLAPYKDKESETYGLFWHGHLTSQYLT